MAELLPTLLDLAQTNGGTLAHRLTERLRSQIAGGRLPAGHRLPSSRAMASSLGISRNTVVEAITQLAAAGYLVRSKNRRPEVAAGAARLSSRPQEKAQDDRPSPRLSSWARTLPDGLWPPAYPQRPAAFRPGLADEREFPFEAWGRCLRHAARRPHGGADLAANDPALCEALLAHLSAHRCLRPSADQILILPTAQAAIALVAKVLMEPGERAWIESPGYGGAAAALRAAGSDVVGVPMADGGLVLDRKTAPPRLVFVTPSHQYPTGTLMPIARRLELLRFTERVGAVVVEDDYDGDFHFDGRPVVPLAGLDAEARVFHVGTFSKVMTAGIRAGYVVVPRPFVEAFRAAQRHLGLLVPMGIQAALAEFIGRGAFLSHIRRMTALYRRRRDHLVEALATVGGSTLSVAVPPGGMQLLARCDPRMDDVALCRRLQAAGVTARPLADMLDHPSDERGLFLGFAAWREEEISAGTSILGMVLSDMDG